MGKEKTAFYEVGANGTSLSPGSYISTQRSLKYHGEKADFKPFLNVPLKELESRLKKSEAEEKRVFESVQKALVAWDVHGAQTLLLQKVTEYLKVPPVKHTNNEWEKQKDGSYEISNLVYKMTFRIERYGEEWKLTWDISYTAPALKVAKSRVYSRVPPERIEHEGSKKYKTMQGAQKYIQSKFDQYVHLFTTTSPPVPIEARSMFCVNGQLLQGYTLKSSNERTEKPVSVDELLDFLDDPPAAAQEPSKAPEAPARQAEQKDTKAARPKAKTGSAKKKAAPVR